MLAFIIVCTFFLVILYVLYKLAFMKPLIKPLNSLPPSHLGNGIDPNSVMIFMVATPEISNYSVHSIEINRKYANMHGYRFEVIQDNLLKNENMPINFTKVKAALEFTKDPTIKYIVHIDADAVVINNKYPITAIINSYMGWGSDIIMAEDCYSRRICSKPGRINSGVFIVKNSKEGRSILNKWLTSSLSGGSCHKYKNVFPNCQLTFFNCVIMSPLGRYVKIVPYNLLNGRDGLFIRHMMQHNTEERVEEFINVKRKNGDRVSLY